MCYTSKIKVAAITDNSPEMLIHLRQGAHILVTTPSYLNRLCQRQIICLERLHMLIFDGIDTIYDKSLDHYLLQSLVNSELPPHTQLQTIMFAYKFCDSVTKYFLITFTFTQTQI